MEESSLDDLLSKLSLQALDRGTHDFVIQEEVEDDELTGCFDEVDGDICRNPYYNRGLLELGPKELSGEDVAEKVILHEKHVLLEYILEDVHKLTDGFEGHLSQVTLCKKCQTKNDCGVKINVANIEEWKQVPSFCTQADDFAKVSEQLLIDDKIRCTPKFDMEFPVVQKNTIKLCYFLIRPNSRVVIERWDSRRKWLYSPPDNRKFITKPGSKDVKSARSSLILTLVGSQFATNKRKTVKLSEIFSSSCFKENHIYHFFVYVVDICFRKTKTSGSVFEVNIHHRPVLVPEFTFVLTLGAKYRDHDFHTKVNQLKHDSSKCEKDETNRNENVNFTKMEPKDVSISKSCVNNISENIDNCNGYNLRPR